MRSEKRWLLISHVRLPWPVVLVFLLPSLLVLRLVWSFSPTHRFYNLDRQLERETLTHSDQSVWEGG